MKKEVKQKLWFCDVCGRQGGFSGTCIKCKKEFCNCCEFIGYNPTWMRLCKDHQEDEEMKSIIDSFSKAYTKLKEKMEIAVLTGESK